MNLFNAIITAAVYVCVTQIKDASPNCNVNICDNKHHRQSLCNHNHRVSSDINWRVIYRTQWHQTYLRTWSKYVSIWCMESNRPHNVIVHYTTQCHSALHNTMSLCTTQHNVTVHYTTQCHSALQNTMSLCTTPHNVTVHYRTQCHCALHHTVTVHYTTQCHSALHHTVTVHYTTQCHSALHNTMPWQVTSSLLKPKF